MPRSPKCQENWNSSVAFCYHIHCCSFVLVRWVWKFCKKYIWVKTTCDRQTNDTSFQSPGCWLKISQEQLCSFIRDHHATFLVKNTLFKEEVLWQPLRKLQSCSPSILDLLTRAFKGGIVCLSTIIGCGEIKGNVKKCRFYVVKISTFWHYP